ncbi:hypothetical protein M885DRAFT_540889 [Pelagophyceae sp. CCMP2097]|nr:hypothetical protein M885DRAFT_540889 [Pelagophyceae sp. CCMP2097]
MAIKNAPLMQAVLAARAADSLCDLTSPFDASPAVHVLVATQAAAALAAAAATAAGATPAAAAAKPADAAPVSDAPGFAAPAPDALADGAAIPKKRRFSLELLDVAAPVPPAAAVLPSAAAVPPPAVPDAASALFSTALDEMSDDDAGPAPDFAEHDAAGARYSIAGPRNCDLESRSDILDADFSGSICDAVEELQTGLAIVTLTADMAKTHAERTAGQVDSLALRLDLAIQRIAAFEDPLEAATTRLAQLETALSRIGADAAGPSAAEIFDLVGLDHFFDMFSRHLEAPAERNARTEMGRLAMALGKTPAFGITPEISAAILAAVRILDSRSRGRRTSDPPVRYVFVLKFATASQGDEFRSKWNSIDFGSKIWRNFVTSGSKPRAFKFNGRIPAGLLPAKSFEESIGAADDN